MAGPPPTDDRAQTLHDYALGIAVFVVAVGVAFSFVPTVLSPFTAPIEASQAVQADRAASQVLHAATPDGSGNVLDAAGTEAFFDGTDGDDLRDALGLQAGTRINVSVVGTNGVVTSGGVLLTAGDVYRDTTAAATVRVVALDDPDCDPTCRLVVRVW